MKNAKSTHKETGISSDLHEGGWDDGILGIVGYVWRIRRFLWGGL
ncbi:hypothetical protein [Agriterribacter sp.]|nr:hypothetical protein [Agriterribacter sp.]HRP57340.1 hypothetical protein [Agriterribacter sp.]